MVHNPSATPGAPPPHDAAVDTVIEHLSLIHGWLPLSIEMLTLVVLAVGIVAPRHNRRWWRVWFPVVLAVGVTAALLVRHYVVAAGLASDPPPVSLCAWVGFAALAIAVIVSRGRGQRRWHAATTLLAVLLSLTSAAVSMNAWLGYVPTVGAAWIEATSAPLPNEADRSTIASMQQRRAVPAAGVTVTVRIPDDRSHFKHRDELVYLPPAWFASTPPPALPTVMMIGGEFNTPTDWPRAGKAIDALDAFARTHDGRSPVVVFVDSGGAFGIDTECVNGNRGNAADHLTREVVPYMVSDFGVTADPSRWAVAGFSSGGTCAVDLAVMHPELFRSFIDISGDLGPNDGTREQTIDRLFGGSVNRWRAFDPISVMAEHGSYQAVSGVFTVTGARVDRSGRVTGGHPDELAAATRLCAAAADSSIDCTVLALEGRHDWLYAGNAFTACLPWLASHLGLTPGRREPMPATPLQPKP